MAARTVSVAHLMTPRSCRLAVAVLGAVALVTALVTLVLGVAGLVPFLVPLTCAVLAAAAVATLRLLAVRARRVRVQQAFAHAMSPMQSTVSSSSGPVGWRAEPHLDGSSGRTPVRRRPTALFDAESAAVRPSTPMELRTAALASARLEDHEDGVPAWAEPTPTTIAAPVGASAWVPMGVPRPTYVDAAKVEREAPAPLDLPEAPRPVSRTPIKTSEAAVARATTATEGPDSGTDSSAPATGRINLDDVLQRRRA